MKQNTDMKSSCWFLGEIIYKGETTMEKKVDADVNLENCPFCGAIPCVKKVVAKNGHEYGRKVTCTRCGAGTRLYESTDDCVDAWNIRTK